MAGSGILLEGSPEFVLDETVERFRMKETLAEAEAGSAKSRSVNRAAQFGQQATNSAIAGSISTVGHAALDGAILFDRFGG